MKSAFLFVIALLFSDLLVAQSSNHWKQVASPTKKDLLSVHFPTPQVGYIVGKDSLIMKTTDSGSTWSVLPVNGLSFSLSINDIVDVNFVNDTVGYIVVSEASFRTYNGVLYKTTNGGATWSLVNHGLNIAPYRSFFLDEDYGFLGGSAFFAGNVIARNNSGLWGDYQNFNFNPSLFINAIDFVNPVKGAIVSEDGIVYTTTDSGKNWQAQVVSVNGMTLDSAINDLTFINDSTIVLATSRGTLPVVYSSDFGTTWHDAGALVTFNYPKMMGITKSKIDSIIAVGRDVNGFSFGGYISWMQNGIWQQDFFNTGLNFVNNQDDKNVFVVGDTGAIYTNKSFATSTLSFANLKNNILVYPNPAHDVIYLEYDHSVVVYSVAITDLTGRLVNNIQNILSIGVSDLSTGIYLLQIKTNKGILMNRITVK